MLLTASQIQLRDWTLEDLAVYQQWRTGHHPWMDFNGPYYKRDTPEQFQQYLSKLTLRIQQNNFSNPRKHLVIADRKTNQWVGVVSRYWESIETNWLCIGIVIYDHNHWSKGIGYEALGLWTQYLFDEMPELVRLDMRTWSGNQGMMRLAEKLGYQLEARFRKARIVKGEYFDSVGYGILREEWKGVAG